MRSDLSKSLKLNCGESGCLEGGIQSGASRQCCRVNAGGDTATQERKKEEEKENREQQRLIRPFLKKREVGNSIRAAETNEQSVINSARRLGLVALHQQRTLSSHVRQSELCRRRLEREREMLTAGRPNDSLSGKHTSTEDRGSSPERQTSQPEVTHPYSTNSFIRKQVKTRRVEDVTPHDPDYNQSIV